MTSTANNSSPLLERLHDIEGLAQTSFWPLAVGWWFVIAVVLLALGCIILFRARQKAFKRSWRYAASVEVKTLTKQITTENSFIIAEKMSKLIRQIALCTHPRSECASLTDQQWLNWLTKHDPKGFDWSKNGRLMTTLLYEEQPEKPSEEQLRLLLSAIKPWISMKKGG